MHVVQAALSVSQYPSYFGRTITDSKSISHSFPNFKIAHVRRNANHLALSLAKYALVSQDAIMG